MHVIVTN